MRDQNQSPFARRLVYETLKRSDAGIEDRLIPGMLLDASPEFRRDAVARLITEAGAIPDAAKATPLYRKAFSGAVHEDQVKTIAEALRKNNEEVDIQRHFGFLPEWSIVGPFDNKEEKGFAAGIRTGTGRQRIERLRICRRNTTDSPAKSAGSRSRQPMTTAWWISRSRSKTTRDR